MVAGKGPAEDAVKAAAKEKGVENDILWFGYFEPQDWVNCYAAANLFTFASVTETQGLVVTEAMAVGTPVVAVGEMGVAEVMKGDKGGTLVDLNVDHFVDAVMKMLSDSAFYQMKKNEAFDYAKEWSAESMAKKLLKKFENTIAVKKAGVKK
jgi:glycosyltransferase involved in cell wall biosynthesis